MKLKLEKRVHKKDGCADYGYTLDGKFYCFSSESIAETAAKQVETTEEFINRYVGSRLDTYGPDLYEKKEKMEEKSYTFVSCNGDVDYVRISREAPKGTLFILVEEKTRSNHPKIWTLLVHNSVLQKEKTQGMPLAGELVSALWGSGGFKEYRWITSGWGDGSMKFPGFIKQEIEAIRRVLNPKDTLTKVSYI